MKSLPSTGILVAFEGIDGAGKTTQCALVGDRLNAEGFSVVSSKEPTNGPWGRILRASAQTERLSPDDELATFLKDRQEHVRDLIAPSLLAGSIVLLDRYYFSTAAYQGIRPPPTPEEIIRLNESFAPEPDLLVILDLPSSLGIARINGRGDQANLFEREAELDMSREVFKSFKQTKRYVMLLDAQINPNELAERITNEILRRVADRISGSEDLTVKDKLNALIKTFGGASVVK